MVLVNLKLLFIRGLEDLAILFPDDTCIILVHFALKYHSLFICSLNTQKSFCEFVWEFCTFANKKPLVSMKKFKIKNSLDSISKMEKTKSNYRQTLSGT